MSSLRDLETFLPELGVQTAIVAMSDAEASVDTIIRAIEICTRCRVNVLVSNSGPVLSKSEVDISEDVTKERIHKLAVTNRCSVSAVGYSESCYNFFFSIHIIITCHTMQFSN